MMGSILTGTGPQNSGSECGMSAEKDGTGAKNWHRGPDRAQWQPAVASYINKRVLASCMLLCSMLLGCLLMQVVLKVSAALQTNRHRVS